MSISCFSNSGHSFLPLDLSYYVFCYQLASLDHRLYIWTTIWCSRNSSFQNSSNPLHCRNSDMAAPSWTSQTEENQAGISQKGFEILDLSLLIESLLGGEGCSVQTVKPQQRIQQEGGDNLSGFSQHKNIQYLSFHRIKIFFRSWKWVRMCMWRSATAWRTASCWRSSSLLVSSSSIRS